MPNAEHTMIKYLFFTISPLSNINKISKNESAMTAQINFLLLFTVFVLFSKCPIIFWSPFNKSSRLMEYTSLSLMTLMISGYVFSFSQLEIVCLDTFIFSATPSCVSPDEIRASFNCFPISVSVYSFRGYRTIL